MRPRRVCGAIRDPDAIAARIPGETIAATLAGKAIAAISTDLYAASPAPNAFALEPPPELVAMPAEELRRRRHVAGRVHERGADVAGQWAARTARYLVWAHERQAGVGGEVAQLDDVAAGLARRAGGVAHGE